MKKVAYHNKRVLTRAVSLIYGGITTTIKLAIKLTIKLKT